MQERSVLQQGLPEERLENPQEVLLAQETRIASTNNDLDDDFIFKLFVDLKSKICPIIKQVLQLY